MRDGSIVADATGDLLRLFRAINDTATFIEPLRGKEIKNRCAREESSEADNTTSATSKTVHCFQFKQESILITVKTTRLTLRVTGAPKAPNK
jgi:hypothetical protein